MTKNLLIAFLTIFLCLRAFAQVSIDTVCIIQLNDVYEISPLEGGRKGGMARVAAIISEARKKYPTLAVLAGDFLSPSVMGTAKLDGERVNGQQMVDLLNAVGIDLVTFGNHEFDIPFKALQKRINESRFDWISSNVLFKDSLGNTSPFFKKLNDSGQPFPQHFIWSPANTNTKIGFLALTIDANQQSFVQYEDPYAAASREITALAGQSDLVLGLTHLTYKADSILLRREPGVKAILGGHEHQHMFIPVDNRFVAKADANAKTVYRHLIFRNSTGAFQLQSTLVPLDSTVKAATSAALLVKQWEDRIYSSFARNGIDPSHQIATVDTPLDGMESSIRFRQTNLGTLITTSMLIPEPRVDAAILNSGSIRIDDMLQGAINEMDIVRVLPFGGVLCDVALKGSLLLKMLRSNQEREDWGGFLQLSRGLVNKEGSWYMNEKAIVSDSIYTIRTLEFLTTGAEKGLEYFRADNPDVIGIKKYQDTANLLADIRRCVIDALDHKKLL